MNVISKLSRVNIGGHAEMSERNIVHGLGAVITRWSESQAHAQYAANHR